MLLGCKSKPPLTRCEFQSAREAHAAGVAELAVHGAAHLRGDADRHAGALPPSPQDGDEHRLHRGARGRPADEAQDELPGAVRRCVDAFQSQPPIQREFLPYSIPTKDKWITSE